MGEVFLTPTDGGGAVVSLSRTMFRKKILPLGTINYKGRRIDFDKAYLTDLATSFGEAYDQVPFMLADKDNAHTMDPERFRGQCKGVEVGEDGLYGTFELTEDAADLVKKNPGLGVSARIVEGYDRADGKSFPRAMQHVLGTLDPRIPGLGAWQEVALSNGANSYDAPVTRSDVVDLTGEVFEERTAMADKDEQNPEVGDELTQEEYDELMALLDGDESDEDEDPGQGDENGDGEEDEDEDEDEGEGEGEGEDDEESADESEPAAAGASLSNDEGASKSVLDLANEQIRELKRARAEDKFKADKREYVRKGVPPALVELARPVLEAPDGFVLDLSNGVDETKVDAAHIVRQLLDSAVGYIDLARERGHSADFSNEESSKTDEDAELLQLWDKIGN